MLHVPQEGAAFVGDALCGWSTIIGEQGPILPPPQFSNSMRQARDSLARIEQTGAQTSTSVTAIRGPRAPPPPWPRRAHAIAPTPGPEPAAANGREILDAMSSLGTIFTAIVTPFDERQRVDAGPSSS